MYLLLCAHHLLMHTVSVEFINEVIPAVYLFVHFAGNLLIILYIKEDLYPFYISKLAAQG